MAHADTTIAAIATPSGRGGIGVIRLSGPKALSIACDLIHKDTLKPRYATLARFYGDSARVLDEGLVLYFPGPHSFTGEDVVELQGHGGNQVLASLLRRLGVLGAVPAQAGEFSARAFANGKLDLVQAEAIADLIDAGSEAAARSAMRSLQGEFSARVQQLLQALIHLRLHVEAAIDFPEEEIDFLSDGRIQAQLEAVQQDVQSVQSSARQGQLLRDGIQVVIAGRPNAGKSSLLNALAGQERAIVTDIAGTTRDVLHETIQLGGLMLTLTDTAGLRETTDQVEQEGIRRAQRALETADLILWVQDITQPDQAAQMLKTYFPQLASFERVLCIDNKCDQLGLDALYVPPQAEVQDSMARIRVSARENIGLELLAHVISERAGFHPQEDTFIARSRHLDALQRCEHHLADAHEQLVGHRAGELMAESLRQAQQALSEITGEFTADDLLGKIFGSFCIGK